MSPPYGSLRAGITALKQERYLEAINLLESFCYCCSIHESSPRQKERNGSRINPEECALARVALVMAYQGSGDLERSTALCQELLEQGNPPQQHPSGRRNGQLKLCPPSGRLQSSLCRLRR